MTDRVSELKLLPTQPPKEYPLFQSRVIAITSGKGGVGKSNIACGLAITLAKEGQRVVVLDADFGLGNLDVLLGLKTKYTLEHVLRSERVLEEILVDGPSGIRLIPTSSGIQELTKLDATAELKLTLGLQRIAEGTDWLLIDTGAGIHDSVIKMLMAAQEIIIVSKPEQTSLIDAFHVVNLVHTRDRSKPIWLLVNEAQNKEEAEEALTQIHDAAQHYLGKDINNLGFIPDDSHVKRAVREQQSFADLFPTSPATIALKEISARLMEKVPLKRDGFNAFWKELGKG